MCTLRLCFDLQVIGLIRPDLRKDPVEAGAHSLSFLLRLYGSSTGHYWEWERKRERPIVMPGPGITRLKIKRFCNRWGH